MALKVIALVKPVQDSINWDSALMSITFFCGDCQWPIDFKGLDKIFHLWMVKNVELQIIDDSHGF